MFVGIIITLVSIIVLMLFYLTSRFRKFNFVLKIKNKYISWLVTLIPIVICIIFFVIDRINTFVVLTYLVISFMIFDLIMFIIKKISKKQFKYYYAGIIAIIFVVIYLGHGYFLAHNVVRTNYLVETNKDVENFRIVQISDSRIGATMDGDKFIEYMRKINETNPDIVVVTGDFVDDDTSYQDMIKGARGLGLLNTKYGVYFIYGNHDKGYFSYKNYSDKELRENLKINNVKILEDEYFNVTDEITLVGRKDKSDITRKSMKDLNSVIDKTKYLVVLDHQPADYENDAKEKVDLVLSGHTHGGQLFPLGKLGVTLGINDNYYGIEKRDNTTFIVNSGIADWAIKFKTGTISEYTVIDIKGKK